MMQIRIVKRKYEERYHHNKIPIYLPDNSTSNEIGNLKKVKKSSINTTKIKKLGFHPQTNLEIGIYELFDYLETPYEGK